jgi:prefoldin subunit 5
VGTGAGVSVEKTLPESKEIVKKRQEELDKTRMSLQQQFVQVVDTIKDHREKIESLVAKMREGTASKDV